MVVVMTQEATEADIEAVCERARTAGGEAFVSKGTVHTVVGLVGDTERFEAVAWAQLPGVAHVDQDRQGVQDGRRRPAPHADDGAGGTHGRGPRRRSRSSPARARWRATTRPWPPPRPPRPRAPRSCEATSTSRGPRRTRSRAWGRRGSTSSRSAAARPGCRSSSRSSTSPRSQHVAEVADCIRVGTRNAQNFELLKETGLANTPVMLKRGLAMTVDEWLQAAEYVAQRGTARSSCANGGSGRSSPPRATRSTWPGWRPRSTSRTCR